MSLPSTTICVNFEIKDIIPDRANVVHDTLVQVSFFSKVLQVQLSFLVSFLLTCAKRVRRPVVSPHPLLQARQTSFYHPLCLSCPLRLQRSQRNVVNIFRGDRGDAHQTPSTALNIYNCTSLPNYLWTKYIFDNSPSD